MELKNIKNYKHHGTEKYQKLWTQWNWKISKTINTMEMKNIKNYEHHGTEKYQKL